MPTAPEVSELVARWLAGVDDSWMPVLASVKSELERAAANVLRVRARGQRTFPDDALVFRALAAPMSSVRVLIVGQDPYPTAGHAVGLAFSVAADVCPLPPSLRNIFRERAEDVGASASASAAASTSVTRAESGDLTRWADQGVLLLNRVLVVPEGEAGGLRATGWEEVTLAIVRALNQRAGEAASRQAAPRQAASRQAAPLVAILWGADAGKLEPELGNAACILSAHPSPLSARRGFFGSRPFSRSNALLTAAGAHPIDW